MYLLHTQLCAWACYRTPCPHRHNVRSSLVLERIGDRAMITNGRQLLGHNLWLNYQYISEVARTLVQYMVELPILCCSSNDSNRIMGYARRRHLQVSSNIRCCRAFQLLKSAYLYLPDMTQLWSANSERCCTWYGELTDTGWDLGCGVTEQTIMRMLKSVEQLTCCFKRSQKAKTSV